VGWIWECVNQTANAALWPVSCVLVAFVAWLPLRFDADATFQREFCVFQAPRLPAMASDRGEPFPADAFDFALSSRRFCKRHMRCIEAIKHGTLQLDVVKLQLRSH
jgi:hypothetical protein